MGHHGNQKEKDPKLIGFVWTSFPWGSNHFFIFFSHPFRFLLRPIIIHVFFFVSDVIGTYSKILEAQIILELNDCQAGGQFIFWVADWFALMNDKMGGDWEKGQKLMKIGMYG